MAVTDYKSPGTITNEDRSAEDWNNPEYAASSNDSRAISDVQNTAFSDWLRCVNFGFATGDVPEGATIDGIEVAIERHAETDNDIIDSAIYLRTSAGQSGDNKAAAGYWPETDAIATYGASDDDWNAGYDDDDIRDATFGVDISAFNDQPSQQREARIDHVQIRVYYTEAGAGGDAAVPMIHHKRRRV
jgi:hypothetical protein